MTFPRKKEARVLGKEDELGRGSDDQGILNILEAVMELDIVSEDFEVGGIS